MFASQKLLAVRFVTHTMLNYCARDGSGYAAKGRMAASLQAYNIQPSFVLFADNGIGHPCHSYGYAFG